MQSEYIQSFPEEFALSQGWQTASAVLGRLPINLEGIQNNVSQQANSNKNTKVSAGINTTYNPRDRSTEFEGTFEVTIEF